MSTISPKTSGLVSLRYVVASLLNRRGDYTLKQYRRFLQIGIEAMGELSIWTLNSIEVIYTHMSAAKTVDLPSDFISALKIGVPVNGKLRVITENKNILLPRVYDDTGDYVGVSYGAAIGPDFSADNYIFFSDHWKGSQWVGGLYGLPGGIDVNYYRIDLENRQIIFSGNINRGEVVIEYISTGVKVDGSSLVPREAVPAIRSYIEWTDVENNPRAAYNEKERKKRLYEEEVAALTYFLSSFTPDQYKRAMYGEYSQSPKR